MQETCARKWILSSTSNEPWRRTRKPGLGVRDRSVEHSPSRKGWSKLVAKACGIAEETLGKKGKSGVLKSLKSRKEFLANLSHRIRFVYTPKHCSWLNQVEIWFSILARRVLRRGNFTSKADLRAKILNFIDYFNEVLAKPFKWTFTGQILKT